ncbi:hypothetical protein [Streptomyces sp. NPDC008150]|uniref:hypothetical protein n=1 Tax=Streptomyces sp. NPDC008150 TaxID=3364816 RepID=UPI0036F0CCEA
MAAEDPADQVTLKLIFWHKGKKPGDTVTVRRDEVRSWYGYAELVNDVPPAKADTTADTGAQKTPDKADDTAKPAAKTSTAK